MKDSWKFISNPFYKVAGYKAAGWGILGIVITDSDRLWSRCAFSWIASLWWSSS